MFNKLLNVKELIGKYYRYAYVDVYLIYQTLVRKILNEFNKILYIIILHCNSRIKNKNIHELIREIHYDKLYLILNNMIKNSFIDDVANS